MVLTEVVTALTLHCIQRDKLFFSPPPLCLLAIIYTHTLVLIQTILVLQVLLYYLYYLYYNKYQFSERQLCLVCLQDHDYLNSRRRGMSKRLTRDLPLVKLLNISITLSPFLGVDSTRFHNSLVDGTEAYWLSLPSAPQGQLVRHWRHYTLIGGRWTL